MLGGWIPLTNDFGEDPDLWISSQAAIPRTSVLCDKADFGPLTATKVGDDGLPLPPMWSNPLKLPDERDDEDTFAGHKLKPIGYEMLLARKQKRMANLVQKSIDDQVAVLKKLVESCKYIWQNCEYDPVIPWHKTIWSVGRHQLKEPPNRGTYVVKRQVEQRQQQLEQEQQLEKEKEKQQKLSQQQEEPKPPVPYATANPFLVPSAVWNLCVPHPWIGNQGLNLYHQQMGYWYPSWHQTVPNWWDNPIYVQCMAQMELFPVNLSPEELQAAQMYAIHGEQFFDMPMGMGYKGGIPIPQPSYPLAPYYLYAPPPYVLYYQVQQPIFYPPIAHQMAGSHPNHQPVRVSGAGIPGKGCGAGGAVGTSKASAGGRGSKNRKQRYRGNGSTSFNSNGQRC
ncbi:uncharacterized protein LOC108040487 [Drosophila rhopaloa]|nr:uncharacterized protein LOC108040487 [Drosophila rhopaloa]